MSFRDVSQVYRSPERIVEALCGVSLDIRDGEFVSLVGPSGCGKSTMLMIASGLLTSTGGEVLVEGTPVRGPQTLPGVAFQDALLLDWRTVMGNVLIQLEGRKLLDDAHRARAGDLLRRVGLTGFENAYPRQLSGGMKQRVSICRALVHDPSILLLDEPFGALDTMTREQLMLDLHRLWYEQRKSVLFITHSIAEAVFLSDRVAVMTPRPGRIERIVDIDLPHPRSPGLQVTPEFNAYVSQIHGLFQARGYLT
ncbi:MAG: ATP-binding cassette domain-containing protein [Micromonosporaceae bacterium]|nr:ATP-binding cassette domain-containing protein [Micromonosporaceae bacterium]